MASVSIQQATTEACPEASVLQAWCVHALNSTDATPDCELTVRLVDAQEMASLNQQYRGKPNATNVLAFPAALPASIPIPLLGDIIICAATVNHEASTQHKTNAAHWAHIVIHGVLHLCGFDHQTQNQAQIMETKEKQLLNELGYNDPYTDYQEDKQ